MPCANPRATASAVKHVWVTDDVLTQAFDRFLQFSNANRRYGSNVPGPLEARRRLAKRRMGMESPSHHNPAPPAYDLGSWFGFGAARAPPDFERGLKWEAPSPVRLDRRKPSPTTVQDSAAWYNEKVVESFFSLPSDGVVPPDEAFDRTENDSAMGVSLDAPLDRRKDDAPFIYNPSAPGMETTVELISTPALPTDQVPSSQTFDSPIRRMGTPRERLVIKAMLPPDPITIDTSTSRFTSLLSELECQSSGIAEGLHRLAAWFESPENDPHAYLTLHLVRWLGSRHGTYEDCPSAKIWRIVSNSIRRRCRTNQIHSDEVAKILMYAVEQSDMEEWIPLLIKLPLTSRDAYTKLLESTLQKYDDHQQAIAKVSVWVNHLWIPMRVNGEIFSAWKEFYGLLAQHFHASDFPQHFGNNMSRRSFAWVLVKYWAPRYAAQSDLTKAPEITNAESTTHSDTYEPAKSGAMSKPPLELADWQKIELEYQAISGHSKAPAGRLLFDLVGLLQQKGVPIERLIVTIFVIYSTTQPHIVTMRVMLDALSKIGEHEMLLRVAHNLIKHFISLDHSDSMWFALAIFDAAPSMALEHYPHLTVRLVKHGWEGAFGILKALDRSSSHRLSEKHIDIVHETAWAWACSPHLSPRSAFRHVWECYRLLLSRHAPLRKQLSSAMVKAGITRAVQENVRLSQTQVKFIIDVVRRVEGNERAAKLDKLVFDYWSRLKWPAARQTPGHATVPRYERDDASPVTQTMPKKRLSDLAHRHRWANPLYKSLKTSEIRDPALLEQREMPSPQRPFSSSTITGVGEPEYRTRIGPLGTTESLEETKSPGQEEARSSRGYRPF